MKRIVLPLLALVALAASNARAEDADVTGLVPTIWWDFESQPSASGLATANKGSASVSFTSEGTKTYQAGVTNGWAVNTASFTPYSAAGRFSTAGNAFTVSLVMTLGSTANGITWNLRNETGSKDLVIRRGTTSGSLLVGVGPQAQASTDFLEATFADGDAAWHLVSVVVEPTALSLYVDGILEDSTTAFTIGSSSGYASQMQFGSHLNGAKTPEARGGGLVDDFRIHDAALTPLQIRTIAAEYGLASLDGYIAVAPSGEPTVGADSFRTPFNLFLDGNDTAEAAIVYGTDAALSAPATNVVGSALPAGSYAASLSGLASGTAYWWKIVATNGANRAETAVASFRTLDAVVPTAYAKRIPIAVSGYAGTETLTNFPVLVTLAADSPLGFDYADCAEGGADLRFADADGALAPHEIERWNTNGTSYVWVLARRLPPAGTSLALYYGADPAGLPAVDPADVWPRYAVVVHGGASLTNAVGNGLSVAAGSTSVAADMAAGIAGGGVAKSANNAIGLNVANPSAKLADSSRFSVSGWFKRDGNGGNNGNGTHILAGSRSDWNNESGFLLLQEQGKYISVASQGGHSWTTGSGTLADKTWGHVAFAYDGPGKTLAAYLGGSPYQSKENPDSLVNASVDQWTFGSYRNRATSDSFKGDMDELRVFDGVASADWIKAECDSVADPAAFAALSPVESTDASQPRIGNLSALDENGVATFSVALAVPGYGGSVPTAVSVFYGTNGVDWTELALGSTNAAATLSGSASGLTGNVRYLWYAVASAAQDGATKTATSPQRSFVANPVEPAGEYKSFTATVDWDGSPEQNVPVLLRVSETAINGFDYGDVTFSQFEMLDAAGRLLPYEIDTWNTNGESLVWVLLPDYRDGATLTVRYGTAFSNVPLPASEVWAGYKGVWHMDSASPADVSGSGNDGAAAGATTNAPGRFGSAVSLQAKTDYVTCGTNQNNSELAPGFTVEGWANFADLSGYHSLFGKNSFISIRSNGGGEIQVTTPGKKDHNLTGLSLPAAGTWWHFALTFQKNAANGCKLYVNGALAAEMDAGDIANQTGATEMWLGRNQWGNDQNFKGLLDEMRLRAVVRSANGIAAEYHAVADDGALTYGSVRSSDTDIPVIGAVSAADGNGSAAFSVELERPGYGGEVPTSVSVFYGTDGENWTELSLGSTNETATLTGTASGFAAGVRYVWYAVATATQDGTPKATASPQRSFVARAFDPIGYYKSFAATVVWDGEPAENVPFLIRISEAGIHGFDYDDVTASGLEILDAGDQVLPFEIDTWNTNGESLVWTRLPVYEDGATVTVRYGAPFANAPLPATDVWSDYVGVWHLNDLDASASAYGSYSNSTATAGIDGEKAQASIADEAGVLGKSVKICDATQQGTGYQLGGVFVPDSGTALPLDLGDTFVISGWFRHKNQDYFWDKLFAKRGKTDNSSSVPPTGAFAIEVGSNGSENKLSVFGGGSAYKSASLNPTLRDTWSYLTFVYDGSTASVYQNGALRTSVTVNPVTDNDGPLCFGNMTGGYGDGTGDSAWCGWIDEVRLADGTPSAAWIAAEYHAMADGGAMSFSPVSSSDASAPVLGVPSVASNPDGSFTVSVAVSENDPASIVCTIGGASYTMTAADAALPATYSATVSDLAPGTHVVSVHATATSGTVVSSTCPDAFHAGALEIAKLSDADEGTTAPGVFRVSRADADPTDLPAVTFDVAFSGAGLAAVADPGLSTVTIPAGAAYVDIAVTPVPTDAVDEDATLSLTVSGTKVGLPSTASLTVVNAGFDLAVRYVSPEGDDENSGGSPETPKLTIAAAVAAVNPVAASRPCTVHVAPGLYPISSPIVVKNAIRILGDDPDPLRTVVSNADRSGDWGVTRRVFTIDHADAFVANLTMQAGYMLGSDSGGNFSVGSAGGTVSNCVVEAGDTRGNQYAAGGRLSGGLVTHTVFRKNICTSGMGSWQGQHGAVLELSGSARAENCLLVDNPPAGSVYLVLLSGSSVMRNCTIADTALKSTNEYCKVFTALRINSADATVLDTVVAGVTNMIDGAACPPTGTGVSNFLNGAFDGDASGLPEGTVTGTLDEFFPRHADAGAPFEARYRPSGASPLRDAGSDYAPMAAVDLSGRQARRAGAAVDIGCYEDSYLRIESTGEPEIGLDSFVADYVLDSDEPANVSIVWSPDASFADAMTNLVVAGATNGVGEASIGDLEQDTLYWWKLVADAGAIRVETAPASFRTLGAPTFGEVTESVSGATVQFSVGLASLACDELGNRLRTYVTVYYTTNGTDYVEKSLGSASWARAVTGTATLPNGDCTWYARAYATSGGRTLEAWTGRRTFRVFHNETPPTGFHRLDMTIAYDGEPAEDIPLLLRLSENIEGFRYADVANNGKDFLFSDGDGNRLPFEIDTWDPAGESLVWVRVPVFADGTVIHLDYGASEADGTADAADVWRRYVGVWHLGETTSASEYGSYPNSTAVAGIDGEKAKASTAGQPGFAGQSVRICNTATKTGAYGHGGVFVPDSGENSPLDLGGTFAISGWFKHKDQNFYYDRLFYKRQKANNSQSSPAGAFAIEMSANNNATPKLDVRGTQNSATATPTLPVSPRNAWTWLTFVYDGKTASVYENGDPVGSYSVTAAKDNDAPLCFGNDTDGRGAGAGAAAWCGWIDEVRLSDGVPTAAWLAAEHAAMAPEPSVVRFAAVRDLEMPVLDGEPDLSWAGNSFRCAATVAYGLGDVLLTTVDLFDGAATTNVAQTFDSVEQLPHSFSAPVSLGENRMYRAVAVLRSSDGTEETLAAADRMVYAGQLTATWVADANIAAMTPAIVRLSRADTAAAVCAPLEVSFKLEGAAVSKGLLESVVSATIPAGTNCVDVAIRPIARSVVPGDYAATLTVTGTNVANPAGTHVGFAVLNAGADPYVRFVAPDGDDANDGALATSPKRTIAGALASFSDAARSALCTVHVAPGFYTVSSTMVLTNAVHILGDDPDPSRVIISNTFGARWDSAVHRIFTISHADALVANLTMQKGSVWGDWTAGGNFFIGTPGGTVSNCVVEAGAQVAGHAGAGGGFLEGGLVTHTVFRRNETTGSSPYSSGGGNKAAVLELSGSGRAENCLIADNPQWASVILVKLGGSSTMRNCTIADSVLPSTNDVCKLFSALRIDSSAATAQNVVIAGVTNAIDGAPCPPTGSVARFRNGAFDGDASTLPAETAVGTPASFFRNRARGDYRPKSGGPLVNAGVNYEPMAGVDLTGVQPRKVGTRVDIGCYEGFSETTMLILR